MHPITRAIWLDSLLLSNVFITFIYSLAIDPGDLAQFLLHTPHLLVVYSGFLHLKDPNVLCAEQLLYTTNIVALFFDVLGVTCNTQRLSVAYADDNVAHFTLTFVQWTLSLLLLVNLGYLYWARQTQWNSHR